MKFPSEPPSASSSPLPNVSADGVCEEEAAWQDALSRALAHSGYLCRLFAARPELPEKLRALWRQPLSEELLHAHLEPAAPDETTLNRQLRRMRQEAMAHIELRDLAGLSALAEVTEGMTLLAEVATNAALAFHHALLARDYGEPLDSEGDPQRLMVVGMGKLGGRELNVSSDVDYIFVYPEEGETAGPVKIENYEFFTRLGKRLIGALGELTEDGQVFRVDMRLRPNGDSGPLVSSLVALENYFITQGREWERYAWIKARVINTGVNAEGKQRLRIEQLHNTARPFVFRRYLDYGAINAMRDLHAEIRREVARKDMAGHIKLGPGGIREIEFIAQVFQLIRGGHDTRLQIRPTLKVLGVLAECRVLPAAGEADLHLAYQFLRKLEHRLQYVDDQQTHTLPTDEATRALIAGSMGFKDWEQLVSELEAHRGRVNAHFEAVFSDPGEGEHPLAPLWFGTLDEKEEQEKLASLGFTAPEETRKRLLALRQSSRYRQLPAANKLRLDAVGPRLIETARHVPLPDLTLARGLDFLDNISRRGAYLALLQQYPHALEKVARMLGASSWANRYLNQHPLLLDELLDARLLDTATDWQDFRETLAHTLKEAEGDTEREMDLLREMHHAQVFRLFAQDLAGLHSIERISDHLAQLADIILETTLSLCWKKIGNRHVESPAFAIIAYGKLGGKELGYASDLDLVYLRDEEDAHPDAEQNYTRLGQRINTWLSSRTRAGQLFETDLRLRPNGDSGLLVCTLEAFREYEADHAWVWEHQALTRARFVAGDAGLGNRFEAARKEILSMKRDLPKLKEEVIAMREKMLASHTGKADEGFDFKHDPGGIIDVEFIVQYLILGYANQYPQLTDNLGNIALLRIAAGLDLIPGELAKLAGDAYREYRRLQHGKRLNEDSQSRVPHEKIAVHAEAVRKLWQFLFSPS
ncbi:MAG: bifunctional [glutamate--ammonia ligase]-adenylyl-L-tyrosine phosphorylase/[glutamate--ammonia-ligase] adenylyltransferase [Zoogloeaceae bacterium]|jgi:glutamate-ammonia-ligase adenylyltransferase|nr:bifunctional [glutamate--ammonia ligase]-adenylyl-L-tyrosine phosphorylase/[glutamate--ammonia-ligase] adenylyltransferase [Zoogloeaceae bacterium]